MAKFCSHCGAELNDSDNFCPHCGKEILAKKTSSKPQSFASDFRQKIFTLKGRLNRWAYFKYSLTLLVLPFVAAIVAASISMALSKSINFSPEFGFGIGLLEIMMLPFILISLVGNVTIPVQRLHDLNLSGWWLIPYYVLLCLGNIPVKDDDSGLFMFSATCGLIGFVCSMFLLFKRGTVGDNKYGADPLENQS